MKKSAPFVWILTLALTAHAQISLYPLKLEIKQRRGNHIWGNMKDQAGNEQAVNAFCDRPILVGEYQARLKNQHQLEVLTRKLGSEDTLRVTCKF